MTIVIHVQLVPFPDHPGYSYSMTSNGCVCFGHDLLEYAMRSKRVTSLVVLIGKRPHHCVLVNIVNLFIVGRLEVSLRYQMELLINVSIIDVVQLVESAVQDSI